MKYFVMIFLCAAAVTGVSCAAEQNAYFSEQWERFGLEELEQSAIDESENSGLSLSQTWEENLSTLIETESKQVKGILKQAVRSGLLILIVVLVCSIGEVGDTLGSGVSTMVGTLGVAAVALTDVRAMLGLGLETIQALTSFSNVLIPVLAVVTAATGAIAGAAAKQGAAVLFSGVLTNLINSVIVPLVYGYAAVSVGCAASGNPGLKRMSAFLKWLGVTLLTVTLLAYVGYISAGGIVSGTADAAAIKATKFAVSGAVPVVGGILADASESVLASAAILKSTVGVFGMVVVFGVCLTPFLRLAIHYLVYKLVAALTATLGSSRLCDLIDSIGTAFGLILGMTATSGMLLLVVLVACARGVSA